MFSEVIRVYFADRTKLHRWHNCSSIVLCIVVLQMITRQRLVLGSPCGHTELSLDDIQDVPLATKPGISLIILTPINTLRTGDADLRFYVTTAQEG